MCKKQEYLGRFLSLFDVQYRMIFVSTCVISWNAALVVRFHLIAGLYSINFK